MSGVQVRGSIKARSDGKFDDRLAASIGERLIALEKASRGPAAGFVAPELPSFGPGNPGGAPGAPGGQGPAGPPGATDHGALTGLEDDDHPQYRQREEGLPQHPHTAEEVFGLEERFLRRGEPAPALPHGHTPESLDLDGRYYRRGERLAPAPHDHGPLAVTDESVVLALRIFGG